MPASIVHSTVGGDTSGNSFTTFTLTIPAIAIGNSGYGWVSWYQGSTGSTSVAVSIGGAAATVVDNSTQDAEWLFSFYRSNITGAPTSIVFTFSGGSSNQGRYISANFIELSGQILLDGHAIHNQAIGFGGGGADVLSSGSITPSTNGDWIAAATFLSNNFGGNQGISPGTGYTINNQNTLNSASPIYDEYLIQTTAASIAGTFGLNLVTNNCNTITSVMAFSSPGVPVTGNAFGGLESQHGILRDALSAMEGRVQAANSSSFIYLGGNRVIRQLAPGGGARRIFSSFPAKPFPGGQALENVASARADAAVSAESVRQISKDAFAAAEVPFALVALDRFAAGENQMAVGPADAMAQLELLQSARRDVSAWAEHRGLFTRDWYGGLEAGANLLADRAALVEDLSVVPLPDAIGSLEGAAALTARGVPAAEHRRLAVIDATAAIELQGVITTLYDAFALIENATTRTLDALALVESMASTVTITLDGLAAIETLGSTISRTIAAAELRLSLRADATATAESGGITLFSSDSSGLTEFLAGIRGDTRAAAAEARSWVQSDAAAAGETLGGFSISALSRALIEFLNRARGDAAAIGEAQTTAIYSNRPLAEYLASRIIDATAGLEYLAQTTLSAHIIANLEALTAIRDHAVGAVESLLTKRADAAALIELLGQNAIGVDTRALLESLALTPLQADASSLIEISGHAALFRAAAALLDGAITVSGDASAAAENIGNMVADAAALIDGGYLVLNKTVPASVSIGRIRAVVAPFMTRATTVQPFDPIAPGLLDVFVCDFTAEIGAATIVSTSWTATFDPGNTDAYDDVPAARVIAAWPATALYVVNPVDNVLQQYVGAYSVAAIGAIPVSAIGGVYSFTVIITLSDTRTIEAGSSVLCVARES